MFRNIARYMASKREQPNLLSGGGGDFLRDLCHD